MIYFWLVFGWLLAIGGWTSAMLWRHHANGWERIGKEWSGLYDRVLVLYKELVADVAKRSGQNPTRIERDDDKQIVIL